MIHERQTNALDRARIAALKPENQFGGIERPMLVWTPHAAKLRADFYSYQP